ncbi:MAG TPA: carbon-nitrogen hydrolase family protein [Gammaproteobacteria bacterium]|nr:carbon-nitrogen hydrolase family protein [Gammaproteobacteria bacterium]
MQQVAAIQMNSGSDVTVNLREAGRLMAKAAAGGARLLVLPENFALMAENDATRVAAGEVDGSGRIQDFLAEKAQTLRVWIVGGTLPVFASRERVYARCPVYNPDGRRAAYYDKIHLFDVQVNAAGESYHESARTEPGSKPVVVSTPLGKLGLAVCYDLRFPELFRQLQALGATLFAVPSAFTRTTGERHWSLLVRARAVENLSFVIAAAQAGRHANGRETWGHSMIVDPWGEVLSERKTEDAGVVTAVLDPVQQSRLRARFPALSHRRL